jgi:isocitrate dehydrogenase kinase/phosphatase
MTLNSDIRKKVKLYYVRSLTNHRQPEIAVTFFNSIITRFLNNSFFHNDFNFVRLTISTENNEIRTKPTYQAHYPKDHSNFFKPSTWLYFQNLLKDGHASDYFGYQERIRFNSR